MVFDGMACTEKESKVWLVGKIYFVIYFIYLSSINFILGKLVLVAYYATIFFSIEYLKNRLI